MYQSTNIIPCGTRKQRAEKLAENILIQVKIWLALGKIILNILFPSKFSCLQIYMGRVFFIHRMNSYFQIEINNLNYATVPMIRVSWDYDLQLRIFYSHLKNDKS